MLELTRRVRIALLAFVSIAIVTGYMNGIFETQKPSSHWQAYCKQDYSDKRDVLPNHLNAVFVAPADDLIVPFANLESFGVTVLASFDQLPSVPLPKVVFVHRALLTEAHTETLRDLYDNGVAIVGMDVSLNRVRDAIGIYRVNDFLSESKASTFGPQFILMSVQIKTGLMSDAVHCHKLLHVVSWIEEFVD